MLKASVSVLALVVAGSAYAATYGWLGANIAGVSGFQGIGDVLAGALVYYAPGSCYTAGYSGNTAVVKDYPTQAVSTTLGCSAGVVAKTAGSNLTTTCPTLGPGYTGCYTFNGLDQSGATNCIGPSGSAANCLFTNDLINGSPFPPYNNPMLGPFAPNGTSLCEHYNGYGDGNYTVSTTGSSYNSTTGILTFVVTKEVWVVTNGYLRLATVSGTGSDIATVSGKHYPIVAPTTTGQAAPPGGLHKISVQAPTSLSIATITGGTLAADAQTLNNNTKGPGSTGSGNPTASGFGPFHVPYTWLWMGTSDGYQDAGTSGGPNAKNWQQDTFPSVGAYTTTNPSFPNTALIGMISDASDAPNINSIYYSGTITPQFYSLVAMFNGSTSKRCINGVCSTVSLALTPDWAGLSFGNGTGGYGGIQCESVMWPGDKTAFANSFYVNQKTRFGNF